MLVRAVTRQAANALMTETSENSYLKKISFSEQKTNNFLSEIEIVEQYYISTDQSYKRYVIFIRRPLWESNFARKKSNFVLCCSHNSSNNCLRYYAKPAYADLPQYEQWGCVPLLSWVSKYLGTALPVSHQSH